MGPFTYLNAKFISSVHSGRVGVESCESSVCDSWSMKENTVSRKAQGRASIARGQGLKLQALGRNRPTWGNNADADNRF